MMEKAFAELTEQSLEQQEFIQTEFDALEENFSGVTFPDSRIGRSLLATLKTIALRAKLGLRRQTIFVSRGGWDHHSALIQPSKTSLPNSPRLSLRSRRTGKLWPRRLCNHLLSLRLCQNAALQWLRLGSRLGRQSIRHGWPGGRWAGFGTIS
jgi:hypothetical protein